MAQVLVFTIIAVADIGLDLVSEVEGGVITVDDSGGADHFTIQAAADAANPGDTVFVYSGTYNEDVLINKSITLTGEDRDTTVINGTGTYNVVEITSDWVNVTELSITNSGGDWDFAGVKLNGVNNCRILDSKIYSNGADGIRLYSSSNNFITNNSVYSNGLDGIYFWEYSNYNTINKNFISDNSHGVDILSWYEIPSYNEILDNIIADNTGRAIYLLSSTHNQIKNNNISNNGGGIYPWLGSSDNAISGNDVVGNDAGIWIDASNNNGISNNLITKNNDGILLTQAGANGISSNIITNNNGYAFSFWMAGINDITNNLISYNNYGFDLAESPENNIYGNIIIDNNFQAQDANNDNLWNDTYPSGGNFWSDYTGSDLYSGPNQDISGSDGIGDNPYVIDGDSQDYYPLMNPPGEMIFLRPGWNLISCPKIQTSTDIEDVLSQLDGSYSMVQWYNGWDDENPWKHYNIHKPPELNDLDSIDHTMGFWIFITKSDGIIFEFEGDDPAGNQMISLRKGWNMVGYPSISNKLRNGALNNLDFGTEVDAIWTYNSGAKKWEEVGELNYFVMGKGYWIHTTTDCVWEVPL
jgi:parallel beta-helix repeat protein